MPNSSQRSKGLLMRAIPVTLLMFAFALAVQSSTNVQDRVELVFIGSNTKEISQQIVIKEISFDNYLAKLEKQYPVQSKNNTFQAFALMVPLNKEGNATVDRIFFVDKKLSRVFEIYGLPDSHRPFGDLKFVKNNILRFDRWSNPHGGNRYEFDLRRRKMVKATSFIEKDYVDLIKRTQAEDSQKATKP